MTDRRRRGPAAFLLLVLAAWWATSAHATEPARIGAIFVEGNEWFSDGLYRSWLGAGPGDPFDHLRLEDAVEWINRNPYRHVELTTRPGLASGTVDVGLTVEDRMPLRIYGTADNMGTARTGLNRVATGLEWGNLFGLGHILAARISASPDLYHQRTANLYYTVPIGAGDKLSFAATYSMLDARADRPFKDRGTNVEAALAYTHVLPRIGGYRQTVSIGGEFKRTDNNLLFSERPIFADLTDIVQAKLGYAASLADDLGYFGLIANAVVSPGGLTGRNTDTAFDNSRTAARARYVYGNVTLDRTTRLPGNFVLYNLARAQASTGNLLGSEQISLAGANSVAGYPEEAASVDAGFVSRNEIRLPPIRPLSWFAGDLPEDELRFFAFHHFGYGRLVHPADFLPSVRTQSVGPGFRYTVDRYLSLTIQYGFALHRLSDTDPRGRAHFALTVTY